MEENNLSKEEILEIFLKNQKFMNQEYKEKDLIIKESKLKYGGEGLFTNKFIPKDSIICQYPLDIIFDIDNPNIYYENGDKVKEEYSEERKKEIDFGDYKLFTYPIMIIGLKGRKKNEMFCGGYLNDRGYHPNKIYKETLNNCRTEGISIVANRNIKKNEELYFSYGKSYWYEKKPHIKETRHQKIKNYLKNI